jgi:hypothetical protein
MKISGKQLALRFVFILLIICGRTEVSNAFIFTDFQSDDSGKRSLMFSKDKTEIDSPGETSHLFSNGPVSLPVLQLKRTPKEVSLLCLETKTKKVKSGSRIISYELSLYPNITISDIIFPSHYFL